MILLLLMLLLFLTLVALIVNVVFIVKQMRQNKKLAYNLLATRHEIDDLKKLFAEEEKSAKNA